MLYYQCRLYIQSRICSSLRIKSTRNFHISSKLRESQKSDNQPSKIVSSTTQKEATVRLGTKGKEFSVNLYKLELVFTLETFCILLVKEASKTVWYTGIVVCGFIATGAILYTVIKELFWSQSPQSIYSDALQKCIEHPKICDMLGEPITGFCDGSGRRGRTNLRYINYPSLFIRNNLIFLCKHFPCM